MEKNFRTPGARCRQGMQRIVDNVCAANMNTCTAQEAQAACVHQPCTACNTCGAYTADTFPLYRTTPCTTCAEPLCAAPAQQTACRQTDCHNGHTYHVEGHVTLWPEHEPTGQCNDALTWDVRCRRDPWA